MVNFCNGEPRSLGVGHARQALELPVEISKLGPLLVAHVTKNTARILTHVVVHHPVETIAVFNVPVLANH